MIWLLWLAVGVVLEVSRALTGRQTLSQFVWAHVDRPWEKALLAAFLVWLTLHLLKVV